MNYSAVSFQPLFAFIKEQTGENIYMSVNIDGKHPVIVCTNLAPQSGVFAAAFSKVEINFFHFDSTVEGFWGTLALSFTKHGGGSNSAIFGHFEYSVACGWKFMSPKDGEWKLA